jgi:hypothetical protein
MDTRKNMHQLARKIDTLARYATGSALSLPILFTIFSLLFVIPAEATTYYVSQSGSDENSCAQAQDDSFGATGDSWDSFLTVSAYPDETVTLRPTSGPGNVVRFAYETVHHVLVQKHHGGSGNTEDHNLTTDPNFVDGAADDLRLQDGSAAIDGGMTIDSVPTDISGVPRPQGIAYAIGAYEYHGDRQH